MPVHVDLRGVQELKLVVTEGGGITRDHAGWADVILSERNAEDWNEWF